MHSSRVDVLCSRDCTLQDRERARGNPRTTAHFHSPKSGRRFFYTATSLHRLARHRCNANQAFPLEPPALQQRSSLDLSKVIDLTQLGRDASPAGRLSLAAPVAVPAEMAVPAGMALSAAGAEVRKGWTELEDEEILRRHTPHATHHTPHATRHAPRARTPAP